MFTHLKELEDFAQAKTVPGVGRKYFTETGASYPSVTTVLGVLSKASIMAWRKRVGSEEANKISSSVVLT